MNKNVISEAKIKGLNVSKIFSSDSTETLLIILEKDKIFPTHTSPRTTLLVVLEGSIDFHIENKSVILVKHQTFTFEKDVEHYVIAQKDSKFLIIR